MERRIGRALEAAERGAQLTRSLLAFSRQQALRPESVDLDALIEDMHDTIAGLVGGQVNVIHNPSSARCIAHIDRTQLQAAIINLVVNARDAMPQGGTLTLEAGQVELPDAASGEEARPTQEYVFLRVRDTGVGMEDAVAEHAFEPFFTTKEVGHGSGLGLSMVHGFIHQSKGVVQLMSKPGRGTTIDLHLPCRQSEAVEPADVALVRDSA
jgi:signal transduction histidine kinase